MTVMFRILPDVYQLTMQSVVVTYTHIDREQGAGRWNSLFDFVEAGIIFPRFVCHATQYGYIPRGAL